MEARIKPLAEDDIAKIKSSISITDLHDVVIGLLKNSLDAGSTEVGIHINSLRGSCIVLDNGLGILPVEFGVDGGLAKSHCKNKPCARRHI